MENNLAEGDESIVTFAYEAGALKRLPRSGWLNAGVRAPESVAEHSFRVAVLAFVIAVQEGADPNRAAVLGLFHDLPETRIGDVPAVGKPYVHTADPRRVIADQTVGLPPELAARIAEVVAEHEGAKGVDATPEARCSRDADKLELVLQAREYQEQGVVVLQSFIDSVLPLLCTETGKRLGRAALAVSPAQWWKQFPGGVPATEAE